MVGCIIVCGSFRAIDSYKNICFVISKYSTDGKIEPGIGQNLLNAITDQFIYSGFLNKIYFPGHFYTIAIHGCFLRNGIDTIRL